MQPIFVHKMRVRDYECDLQGIVNNAVYQHYTEACRHEFIETKGIPRDWFEVRLSMEKNGLRYVFHQDIVRLVDSQRAEKDPAYAKEALCVRTKTDIVAIVNGRLSDCAELNEKFGLTPAE